MSESEIFYIDIQHMRDDLLNYDAYDDRFNIKSSKDWKIASTYEEAILYAIEREKIWTRDFRNFDYNHLKKLTKIIYGDSYQSEMIDVISLVQEKFIRGFINIPHLDDLFSEHYFEYEWEMHSSLEAEAGLIGFYRDHYFHQIRNMYEIFKIFEIRDGYFLKYLLNEMHTSSSNTARYCSNAINEAREIYLGNSEIKEKLLKKLIADKNGFIADDNLLKDYFNEYALSYIVRGALYVAALTHDVGYPIEKQIRRNKEFVKFISSTAYSKNNFDFDNLRETIDKSILFGIVGADNIKKSLSLGGDRLDHGVVSAIVLLAHYYEHGTIYELDPLKRAIIELAAIINYDHTSKYSALGDNNSRENYPRWKKNPLSIIFRMADDIQEWDRVYFEVKPYPNIRICSKCLMPMLKKSIYPEEICDSPITGKFINEFTKYKHVCNCQTNNKTLWESRNFDFDYGAYKQQMSFNNQKINYVIACNRIYYILQENKLNILIDYNPYKLLEMLILSGTNFHMHRLEEIMKLIKFLKFSESGLFDLNAYVHFNADFLTCKIVYDFLSALYYISETKPQKSVIKKDKNEITTEFEFNFNSLTISTNFENKIKSIIFDDRFKLFENASILILKQPFRGIPMRVSFNEALKQDLINELSGFFKITQKNPGLVNIVDNFFKSSETLNSSNYIINGKDFKPELKAYELELEDITDSNKYLNKNSDMKNDPTNNFYSRFYLLGLMNDFTEMVKNYISNEDLIKI